MIILGLSIENMRKIRTMNMEFSSKGMTQIKGQNMQGKTTIIDAWEFLLRGKKYLTTDMISHGQSQAIVSGTLKEGDDLYAVTRTVKQGKNPTLKITKNGGSYSDTTPEAFFKGLINDLTFDPRPFMNRNDREKTKFMMEVAGIDFSKIDAKIKTIFDEREIVGREVKRFGKMDMPEKVKEVSIESLLNEREAIVKHNDNRTIMIEGADAVEKKIFGLKDDRAIALSLVESNNLKILELQKEVIAQEAEALALEGRITKGESIYTERVAAIPEVQETKLVDEKMKTISDINAKALLYTTAVAKAKEKDAKEVEYKALTKSLELARTQKLNQLSNSKLPVPGLNLKEDGLYFNSIHSSNWSESQSMRISSDLCLALDPTLKAIFIDRGEAYDKERLKELEAWGVKNDIQIVITIVAPIEDADDNDDVYYIVEGELLE